MQEELKRQANSNQKASEVQNEQLPKMAEEASSNQREETQKESCFEEIVKNINQENNPEM